MQRVSSALLSIKRNTQAIALPLTRALVDLTAQRPTLALLARILRENGRAYAPRYAVAFAFMFIFAGATALSAWMMRSSSKAPSGSPWPWASTRSGSWATG